MDVTTIYNGIPTNNGYIYNPQNISGIYQSIKIEKQNPGNMSICEIKIFVRSKYQLPILGSLKLRYGQKLF